MRKIASADDTPNSKLHCCLHYTSMKVVCTFLADPLPHFSNTNFPSLLVAISPVFNLMAETRDIACNWFSDWIVEAALSICMPKYVYKWKYHWPVSYLGWPFISSSWVVFLKFNLHFNLIANMYYRMQTKTTRTQLIWHSGSLLGAWIY